MTEFCSIDRVTYPLPCQQSYMRWSAHSLPPLDTVSQGRRESGLQQMHPEALQNVRKRAFEMLDAGMNCVEIARKLSAHPQTIRKWKKHRETFGEELSVIGLSRAIGETMVVLMVAGGAGIIPESIFDPVRPMTAGIAAEMAEAAVGGEHYHALYAAGLLLFLITFAFNLAAWYFTRRLSLRSA